jgi:hypothetical protein
MKGGRRRMHVGYCWKIKKEGDHWEDQDVGGWTILKICLREIEWDCMDWINLAHDGEQWRDHVNKVMNLRVP